MNEVRVSYQDQVQSPMPTLHDFLWAAGKTTKDVLYRYEDPRTEETVFVLRPSHP